MSKHALLPRMTASTIIERLGGTKVVAQLCDISQQAVSQWRTKGIPKAQRNYLRAIRPDAFQDASSSDKPAAQQAA
jgi:hypothetical protein